MSKSLNQENINKFFEDYNRGRFAPYNLGESFCIEFGVKNDVLYHSSNNDWAYRFICERFLPLVMK